MKRYTLGLAAVLTVLSWVTPGWAEVLTGTLERIDGQYYILKDVKGKEYRLHFDSKTRKTGEPAVGNKVEIDEQNGHSNSIKVVMTKKPLLEKQKGGH